MTKAVYYPRLELEIICRGLLKREIAEKLGISNKSLSKKLNGDVDFLLNQALAIQKTWFPEISIEDLFKHEEKGA